MSEGVGTKRSVEGGNNAVGGGKKMRGDTDTVTLRFLLLSKHAGGIIGKGGETIKRLRSDYNAIVYVPDGISNERVLSIGADRENSINVFRECLPLMHEPPYPVSGGGGLDQGGPNTIEVDFLVHSSQVGGIIGKAGARIKQIRDETNASIKVYQDCLPNCKERVVAIGGEEEEVVNALQQVLDVMHEQPIKGEVTLYDPNYDGSYDEGYDNNFNGPQGRGGMGGGMRGGGGGPMRGGMGGMGPGGPPQGGNFGPQGGYGGPGGGYGGGPGGGFQQQNYGNNYGNQGAPQGGGGYGGAGGGGGNFNTGGASGNMGGSGGGPPPTSTQVTIPNDMAGAIIGQGGRRIQEIRQKCGATIKFADPEQGKKDRLITISGTEEQIQYAQYLMQQCVIQNHT